MDSFAFSRNMWKWSKACRKFVFHSVWFLYLSVLWSLSTVCSTSLLKSIHYVAITECLLIYPPTDIRSSLPLVYYIESSCEHLYACKNVFWFLFGKHIEMEYLDHIEGMPLISYITVFQGGFDISHFHQLNRRIPVCPDPHQYLLWSIMSLISAVLTGGWHISSGFALHFPGGSEQAVCLIAICTSSLWKPTFKSYAQMCIESLVFSFGVLIDRFYVFDAQVTHNAYN